MAHFWQGPSWKNSPFWNALRTVARLTAARARGYGLILLTVCTIAFAGWIALADGLIDRNDKPLGTAVAGGEHRDISRDATRDHAAARDAPDGASVMRIVSSCSRQC